MALSSSAAQQAYAKVLAKAWSDPAYKARLLADPAAALTELGVPVPKQRTLRVIEDTDSEMHVVLPRPPKHELAFFRIPGPTLQLTPTRKFFPAYY